MCFVLGVSNAFGLKSRFLNLKTSSFWHFLNRYRSTKGILEGSMGVSAAILDETIGGAIVIKSSHNILGVTIEFSIRFNKPVPLQDEVRV